MGRAKFSTDEPDAVAEAERADTIKNRPLLAEAIIKWRHDVTFDFHDAVAVASSSGGVSAPGPDRLKLHIIFNPIGLVVLSSRRQARLKHLFRDPAALAHTFVSSGCSSMAPRVEHPFCGAHVCHPLYP